MSSFNLYPRLLSTIVLVLLPTWYLGPGIEYTSNSGQNRTGVVRDQFHTRSNPRTWSTHNTPPHDIGHGAGQGAMIVFGGNRSLRSKLFTSSNKFKLGNLDTLLASLLILAELCPSRHRDSNHGYHHNYKRIRISAHLEWQVRVKQNRYIRHQQT